MAKWRRWTERQPRLCTRRGLWQPAWGSRTGSQEAPCRARCSHHVCANTQLRRDARGYAPWSRPPLWSTCVQVSGGPAEWSHRRLSAADEEGAHPLCSPAAVLRLHPAGSPPWGHHDDPPRRPLLLTVGPPLPPPGRGAYTTGPASASWTRPSYPALVRPSPGLAYGGLGRGGSELYMSPSAFNTACLLPATVWTRRRGTWVSPLHPQFPQPRLSGSGPRLSKGPCKYVHFSGQGQQGAAPSPFFMR